MHKLGITHRDLKPANIFLCNVISILFRPMHLKLEILDALFTILLKIMWEL